MRATTLTALMIALVLAACDTSSNSQTDVTTPTGDVAGDTSGADTSDVEPVPTFDESQVDYDFCEVDEAAIDTIMAGLTLRQEIGQHVAMGLERGSDGPSPPSRVRLEQYFIGGCYLGPPNGIVLGDAVATATLVHQIKTLAFDTTGIPLLVGLDQEGGPNAAVNATTGGTDTLGSMPIGATFDPQVAYEQFSIMGRELHAMGFNMDFGPVLDTLRSTRNGNMNTRSFGPHTELNVQLGLAAVAGLQQHRVLAMGKHFPGDGLADGNTHQVEVTITADREVLEANILPPFAAAIEAGLDGIMTVPERYDAFDTERSAITSRAVTTDLLRGDLGFEGLVITDALGMEGVGIGLDEADHRGLEALKAGADVLLYVQLADADLEELYTVIEAALADGSLDTEEFHTSTRRILAMKQKYCLFEEPTRPDPENPEAILAGVAQPADAALSRAHAEQAVVLLEDDGTALPLTSERVLYVGPATLYQDPGSGWPNIVDFTLGKALEDVGLDVGRIEYMLPFNPSAQLPQLETELALADVVVLGTLQGRFSLEQQQLVEWLLDTAEVPVVHVMLGVPFDYAQTRGRVAAAVALMSHRGPMVRAGADFLSGALPARGRMLYDLDALAHGGVEAPINGGDPPVDRCADEGIDCSGYGICVDTGATYGCICYQNWHPSDDGLDCIADGYR